ncbi:hypothetical protein SXCC_02515 [Gluconacetobacter sp. SXCC-1]|nr:hypothetical protein SXCC_02515 [Gluconacetobacter sp. SXCC-1]
MAGFFMHKRPCRPDDAISQHVREFFRMGDWIFLYWSDYMKNGMKQFSMQENMACIRFF